MRHAPASPRHSGRDRRAGSPVSVDSILLMFVLTVTVVGAVLHHDAGTAGAAGPADGHAVPVGAERSTDPDRPAPSLVHRVETDDPVVFVTIDDGNHASKEALDIVREHDMPVSLFLNEGPVALHGSYFDEYIALGNHVHSHTLTHAQLTTLDADRQEREICGMVDVLDERYGSTDHVGDLFRAPYGASDATTKKAARRCGLGAIVHWTAVAENGEVAYAAGTGFKPGDIVLAHFTDSLPQDLRAIRQLAADAGLTIARLEDYL
ncbi:polysaccharide deacetylase family protein [Isoptericola croceus]|uniref:polysaccharide deacetylase family protein n=1 Tax=Isoptericola croceus TaxID=3031406 RepID=UPI0023F9F10D|nr:polysaccharide deacetylase family protein [Isoptericola croceus]